MKCRVCREPAVIDVRRHNANFCADHFLRLCRDQVAKAIDEFAMIDPDERVLVAVSGGKDSLALWDILLDLGYQADGLYLGLGIGDYSDESGDVRPRLRSRAGRCTLHRGRPARRPTASTSRPRAAAAQRVPCSACGLSKRHLFDKAALDGGYDVVATGHNLDDEAAVLFGNMLRWQTEYLGRQLPVLPAATASPARSSRSCASASGRWRPTASLRGIDYIVEECPMAAGNKHLGYKEALNDDRGARRPAPSTPSTSASSTERRRRFAAEADGRARPSSAPCAQLRRADHRRGVRVLPARRAARAGARAGRRLGHPRTVGRRWRRRVPPSASRCC